MTGQGFSLLQGPPGTGKTQTVHAVLNVLHIIGYHRHYESIKLKAQNQLIYSLNSSNPNNPSNPATSNASSAVQVRLDELSLDDLLKMQVIITLELTLE